MTTFADLGLPPSVTTMLEQRGIASPFPIQSATIPDALAGRDVLGRAPTGSGKTFAFGLPVLVNVASASAFRPRALILVPTRELADQITTELQPYAKALRRTVYAIYGGVGYGPQRSALRRGVDVLVSTPGRLEDLIDTRDIDLSDAEIVVVDEADRMADMGFLPAVRRLLDRAPRDRQTMLFSATLDGDVAILTQRYQHNPARHESLAVETANSEADHHFWRVERNDRLEATAAIVADASPTIVFTRTRHGADRLSKQLARHGVDAVVMHGGKSQPQRTKALAAFTSGRAKALIATDVAARGIHVDDVASVLHFDPPEDAKAYVHRSGRTARAGATGSVYSFIDGSQTRDAKRMIRDLDLGVDIVAPRQLVKAATSAPRTESRTGSVEERREPRRDQPERAVVQNVEGNVYVANLPYSMTSDQLKVMFAEFGPVQDATVVTHRNTTKSRGFGFVSMADSVSAIAELDGVEIEGRALTVRAARPKQ